MSVTGLHRLLYCASPEERANFYRQIKIELERSEIQNEKCERLIEVALSLTPGLATAIEKGWPNWMVGATAVSGCVIGGIGFTNPEMGIPYACLIVASAIEAWIRKTRDIRRMEREFAARRLTDGV